MARALARPTRAARLGPRTTLTIMVGRDDEDEPEHTAHSVFVSQCPTNQICLTDATKAAGHIILDTACQRLRAGRSWSEAQKHQMKSWSITPFELDTSEYFEFGKGAPIHSTYTMYFPVGFGEFCVLWHPASSKPRSHAWLAEHGCKMLGPSSI